MRTLIALFLLTASGLPAQQELRPFPRFFPPALQSFLELTSDQVTKIEDANSRFRAYEASRSARRIDLQFEISAEISNATIDPMALGLRHREIELIRREVEAERAKTRTEVQAVLTAAQRTKLATLDQALRLQSTACSAVSQNLLVEPIPDLSFASLLIGFNVPGLGPCGASSSGGFILPGRVLSQP